MNTTRRSFLGGMAAASALSSATVAVAANAPAPVESPELLTLWKEFTDAQATFEAAADELQGKRAAYHLIAPAIPDGITCSDFARPWWAIYSERMQDVTREEREDIRGPDGFRLRICNAAHLRGAFELQDLPADAPWLLETVEAYDDAVDQALEQSGLSEALARHSEAEWALSQVIRQLAQTRARTPAGLGMKVRATAVYAALGKEEKVTAGTWLADAVWNDLGEGE